MNKPYASNGLLVGLVDFLLLVGTGAGAWWLVDAAVAAAWCGGGRWDGIFLLALLGGYCPGPGAGNILYLLPLMLLFGAARDGGRPAYRSVAYTGLAAIAVMSAGDVLAGLAITCPPPGEDLPDRQHFLRIFIKAVAFGFAVVPAAGLRSHYQPRPEGPGKDEQSTREAQT